MISRIRDAITVYGLTAADLGFVTAKAPKAPGAPACCGAWRPRSAAMP